MEQKKENKSPTLQPKKEVGEHKIAVLDFDDFSLSAPNFDRLLKLKEHFPNLKVTLFFYPFDETMVSGLASLDKYYQWAQLVKQNLDWIELAVHGFFHDPGEFMKSKEETRELLARFHDMTSSFTYKKRVAWLPWRKRDRMYIDLPYQKVVKGPKWMVGEEAYEYFRDNDWLVAIDRNQPKPRVPGLKTYVYNWSIEETPPLDYKILKGHGHLTTTTPNSLGWEHCFMNILRLPPDVEFLFISEYYERFGKN